MRRERRRAKAAKHPILLVGPVAPARRAAHGTSRKVAGGRRMEPSGSGSASLSLGPLRARPSVDDCFRGGVRSKESAREGGALRHSSTVYCAKHLYTLDNEMCSTCAKWGWRDVRAPVRQTGNALGTGEQWLLPPLHSLSGAWLKPCPW